MSSNFVIFFSVLSFSLFIYFLKKTLIFFFTWDNYSRYKNMYEVSREGKSSVVLVL